MDAFLSGVLGGVANAALTNTGVSLSSNVTPNLSLDLTPQGGDGNGSSPSFLMRLLAPKVVVTSDGSTLITLAPYGEPSGLGPIVFFSLVALLALGLFLFVGMVLS